MSLPISFACNGCADLLRCVEVVAAMERCRARLDGMAAIHALIVEAIRCCQSGSPDDIEFRSINVSLTKAAETNSQDNAEAAKGTLTINHTGEPLADKSPVSFIDRLISSVPFKQTAGALGFPQIAWGDAVAVMSTGIYDTEVKRFVVDVPAEGRPTWSQLPSMSKPDGAYFSGFEVSFDFHGVVEDAALRVYELIGMVTILQPQTSVVLALQGFCDELLSLIHDLPSALKKVEPGLVKLSYAAPEEDSEFSRLDRFQSGVLQTLIAERGICVDTKQGLSITTPFLASASATHRSWNLDCIATYEKGVKDEITVRVFRDWSPLLDGSSVIMALSESKLWSNFGISIADAEIHNFSGLLQAESSYMEKHLCVYLHLHNQHISCAKFETISQRVLLKLVKEAVTAALQQLKAPSPGEFSSVHQAKVDNCLPDLAGSLAIIVTGSSNESFQEECSRILGVDDVSDMESAILQRLSSISFGPQKGASIASNKRQPKIVDQLDTEWMLD